jgi:hypothetical protein
MRRIDMQQKFKRVTVLNNDGTIRARYARFSMFLKQGISTDFTHALLYWYDDSDTAWVDDKEREKTFIVPLSQVFFEDTPEW